MHNRTVLGDTLSDTLPTKIWASYRSIPRPLLAYSHDGIRWIIMECRADLKHKCTFAVIWFILLIAWSYGPRVTKLYSLGVRIIMIKLAFYNWLLTYVYLCSSNQCIFNLIDRRCNVRMYMSIFGIHLGSPLLTRAGIQYISSNTSTNIFFSKISNSNILHQSWSNKNTAQQIQIHYRWASQDLMIQGSGRLNMPPMTVLNICCLHLPLLQMVDGVVKHTSNKIGIHMVFCSSSLTGGGRPFWRIANEAKWLGAFGGEAKQPLASPCPVRASWLSRWASVEYHPFDAIVTSQQFEA